MFGADKIHVQLRRLRNECSLLKDAVITAIPSYSSKVLFTTCSKSSASPSNTIITDTLTVDNSNTVSVRFSSDNMYYWTIGFFDIQFKLQPFPGNSDDLMTLSEEKMGFIMMECGFEGVSFKVISFLLIILGFVSKQTNFCWL